MQDQSIVREDGDAQSILLPCSSPRSIAANTGKTRDTTGLAAPDGPPEIGRHAAGFATYLSKENIMNKLFAALMSATVLLASYAFAQDTMKKDEMGKDAMGKSSSTTTETMGKDKMGKEDMGKDKMSKSHMKKSHEKKGGMGKDEMGKETTKP